MNMESDPLRPKSMPLNDVILWFEFLLKPNLLGQHLRKGSADPSPIDLIQQFLAVAPEPAPTTPLPPIIPSTPDIPQTPTVEIPEPKIETVKLGRKQLALKILALKVAAFLNFNLDMFEKNLPLEKQFQLLSDLCTVVTGKLQTLPMSPVSEMTAGTDGSKHGLHFALTLYYRFVLRAQVTRGCQTKVNKMMLVIPGTDPNAVQLREDYLISQITSQTQASLDYLQRALEDPEPFRQLVFDCFVALDANSDAVHQKFDLAVLITPDEVKAQIHYDLCIYHIYMKNYKLARENVIACHEILKMVHPEVRREFKFCSIDDEELQAYLMACGVFDTEPLSLMHQMNECIHQQYSGIQRVFREDNMKREIPMTHRKIIEQDIEGSISTQKLLDAQDLYTEVIALNVIRYILDDSDILSCDLFLLRYKDDERVLKTFLRIAYESHASFDYHEKNLIKEFLLDLVAQLSDSQLEVLLKPSTVFSQAEIDDFKRQRTQNKIELSGIGASQEWTITDGVKNLMPRLEQAAIERQLINCMNANQIRKILVKLAGMNSLKPPWSINPAWVLPDPIRVAIMSLSRSFLQDFAFILAGKAKEMVARQEYLTAISLLNVIRSETNRADFQNNPNVIKLGRLIHWETLLVQIQQCLDEWSKKPADSGALIRNCKACLGALTNNETIIPRIEVLEYVSAVLLNLGEFTSVIMPERRIPSLELYSVFASAVLDIDKSKGQKNKISKEAWDLVLPVFLNNQHNPRRGPSGRDSRDSPSLPQSTNLYSFFKKLRDPIIVSIVLSLLCRIHNVLKDEQNLELNAEYMFLWPTNVPNPNAYNLKAVAESINALLKHAFEYYPNYVPWLKIKGDLEYAHGNYETAMKFYVSTLITSSEYCTQPLIKPVIDDFVIRRMIKCSANLGCYMQAAVLCQFFDETDYSMAFKSISEKVSNTSDAMDAYYGCIWDPTLLEFIINMHSKKGEHKRKLQAISYMGLLELNANNNDEIRAQAASTRKIKFLRALAKQYMF